MNIDAKSFNPIPEALGCPECDISLVPSYNESSETWEHAVVERELCISDRNLPQVSERSPLVRPDLEIGQHAAGEVLRPRALAEAQRLSKARRETKDRVRSVVDAAMLRALATIVESTGVPLRDWGDGLSRSNLQNEVSSRTGRWG
jgi:hypothetical protein